MATQKKRLQVSFTEEQYENLLKLAKDKGFSKSAIIVLALEEYSKNKKIFDKERHKKVNVGRH